MRPGGFILGLLAVGVGFSSIFGSVTAQAKTRVEVSVFYPGAPWNISALNGFQSQLGIKFSSAKWYGDWATPFDSGAAQSLHSNGYIPEMTWEPSVAGTGVAYSDVTSGDYDNYITQTAQAVKNLGFTIRISLAPEMNTDWTPWGIGKQGNNANNHKLFWRYVVQKFRDAGANNVKWIWSPNVRPWNAQTLYGSYADIFPGSSYVDYMGLDGYNWGKSQSWSVWQSFREIFLSSYNELAAVSSKDILIMEMASTEVGGNKAAWISEMFSQLGSGFSRIKGFTWFHINKETDWRISSSAAAQAAFVAGYHGQPAPPAQQPAAGNSSSSPGNEGSVNQSETAGDNSTGAVDNRSGSGQLAPTTGPAVKTASPIQPKIAGTQTIDSAPSLPIADKMGVLSSLLLGGTIIGGLFVRRFRLIHATHFAPAVAPFGRLGHNFVDGLFHRHHHNRHSFRRARRTIR